MKRKLLIIFIAAVALMGISGIAHATMNYQLLEALPGFFNAKATPTLPEMILAIYKFGIWTVGIAGFFMLTIGGFWYMTSAGNNATAETAKKIIADSLLGIVAALAAYLIMYVINPDLTKINIAFGGITIEKGVNEVYKTTAGTPSPSSVNFSASCTASSTLDIMKSASASAGADPCLTFALLSTESQCNPKAKSSAGACGISQIKPTGDNTCDYLINNPNEAINLGVKQLMATSESKLRGSLTGKGMEVNQALMDLYAAYNGGVGALGTSKDCTDPSKLNDYGYKFVKWDCPIKQGGYTETVKGTTTFVSYYMKCKSKKLF